jgi:hypothetical protein
MDKLFTHQVLEQKSNLYIYFCCLKKIILIKVAPFNKKMFNKNSNYFFLQRSVEKKLSLYLNEGHWFISMYNDFGDAQNVEFVASQSVEMTEGCPNGCNAKGECVLGRCQCQTGYGGDDCSQGKKQNVFYFL